MGATADWFSVGSCRVVGVALAGVLTAVSVFGMVASSTPPAYAAVVAYPPTDLVAASDSEGLAVNVSWSAPDGAVFYNVYRSTGPGVERSQADFLGRSTTTSFRDTRRTFGQTLYYVVTAVGSDGAESPSSVEVSVTTSDTLTGDLSDAVAWLAYQQEAAQGFRVSFDEPYPADHPGLVSGTVEDADQWSAGVVQVRAVGLDEVYLDPYQGPVSGWTLNADPADYQVGVYSYTDQAYLQGTYPIGADGSWSSGQDDSWPPGQLMAGLILLSDSSVVAWNGGPTEAIDGLAVRVYSRTDIDYFQEETLVRPDGTWSTIFPTFPGEKIAHLVRLADERVVNSTEWADSPGYQGLVRSFAIPQDDPDYGYANEDEQQSSGYRLEQRSWLYDDALAILGFVSTGNFDRATAILAQLAGLQLADGSFHFSYDVFKGELYEAYRRSGALAWLGTAAVEYELRSGDSSYRNLAIGIADYLLSLQVTQANGYSNSDPRYGSVMGGWGSYDAEYNYVDAPVTWVSTEHNIDAYFFFRDLAYVTGDQDFYDAAQLVKQSLLVNHWNEAEGRFNQGVDDASHALDTASWGGLFLLAVGEDAKAASSAQFMEGFRVTDKSVALSSDPDSYNQTYSSPGPIDGYKPYGSVGYDDPPDAVWAEGSWGAILFKLRLGQDVTADLESMRRLQDVDPLGGFLQMTEGRRSWPYEFHTWPGVGGTGWGTMVLGDASSLWRPDGWPYELNRFLFDDDGFAFGESVYSDWDEDVNASLGNFVTSTTDVAIGSVGPSLELTRTYNSLDSRPGAFGVGWSFNYEMTWQEDAAGNVTILFGDGRREMHARQPDGTFAPPEGYFSMLAANGSGGYTLTLKDRTVYHLSATGRLDSLSDPAGRVLDLAYDPEGYLSTVTDTASGRYLTFVWTDGTISEVATNPVSQAGGAAPLVWKFYYEDEYLTRACDSRNNSSQGSCTVYDVTDGRITAVVTPRGTTQVRIAYTAEGSVEWREDGTGNRTSYSYEGQRVTTTDPRGNTWVEEHDSRYRVVLKTDPAGYNASYQYDDTGNRTQIVDSNGNVATMNYDSRGNLIALVDGEGHTEVVDSSGSDATVAFDQAYDYDYVGPVAGTWARVDPSLYRVDVYSVTDIPYLQGSYSPNADGTWSSGTQIARTGTKLARLVRVADGAVVASTDPSEPVVAPTQTVTYEINGHTQYYSYDTADNMVARRDGRSSDATDNTYKTAFTYDAARNKLTETNPLGHTRSWEYTDGTESAVGGGTVPAGLMSKQIDARGNESGATPDDYATTYLYYATGDLAQVTTPAGLVTDFAYDELGRLTSETVTDPVAGRTATSDYTYDEVSNTVTVAGPAAVNAVSGGSHRLKITNTYDENSNLTRTVEQDITGSDPSRTTIYEYDADDRQYRTTDPESGVLTREFDAVGNVVAVTDQEGRRVETVYDNRNLAVQVIHKAFDDGHGGALRDITVATTTYDDAGRKLTETDAEGRVTQWSYDRADRVTSVKQLGHVNFDLTTRDVVLSASVYDDAGNPTSVTTGDGTANQVTVGNGYDPAGRLTTSTLDPGGLNRVTTYTYDASGNVENVTLSDGSRTEEQRSVYDESGRLVQATVENGTSDLVTTYGYDARGNRTTVTTPEGDTTSTGYDELNHPVTTTAPQVTVEEYGETPVTAAPQTVSGYDTWGNATHRQDERGNVTVSTFDALNRVGRIDHPTYADPQLNILSPFETFAYDAVGNLTSQRTRRGNVTDFVFDDFNRVATQTDPLVTSESVRGVTVFEYDDVGNTTAVVDQNGARTESTYDALNRRRTATQVVRLDGGGEDRFTSMYDYDDLGNQTLSRDPVGNDVVSVFNAASERTSISDQAGETSTFLYDVAGRQVRAVDPEGRISESMFDVAGRLVNVTRKAPDETMLTVTGYGYDLDGNRTSVTSPRGFQTTYVYDAVDRLTAVTVPVDDTSSITTSYGYDASGNVTNVSDGNGNVTWSTFQVWNLKESTIEPPTAAYTAVSDRTWTINYDGGGLPVQADEPGGVTVTRVFDELGRMTTESGSGSGVVAASRALAYDLIGNVTGVDHPSGTLTYTFDDRRLLVDAAGPGGTATFGYDSNGRVTARTDAAGTHGFTWTVRSELDTYADPVSDVTVDYDWTTAGLPDTVTYGTAGTRTYGFDDLGRLVTDEWHDSTDTTVAGYVYGYDEDSNVTSKTVTLPGNTLSGDHTYSYDRAGRLTTWTQPDSSATEYAWDDAGNRVTAGSDTYTYDQRNRLTAGPDGTYSYNPRGDVTSITGSRAAVFTWDALGRTATSDTGTAVSYDYDGLDRVATRNGTLFTYTGTWTDPTSDGANTYSRSPSGRIVSHANGTVAALVGLDRHGDVTWLTTPATGTVTDTTVYDPFGSVAATTGTTGISVGFQGDYTDPASGDIWMGARWYDPTSAQFRTRDTVFGELMIPISLNRYTYGFANPLGYWDPDGRFARNLLDGAGARIVGYNSDGSPRRAPMTKAQQERQDRYLIETTERQAMRAELIGRAESQRGQSLSASEQQSITVDLLLGRTSMYVLPEDFDILNDRIETYESWIAALFAGPTETGPTRCSDGVGCFVAGMWSNIPNAIEGAAVLIEDPGGVWQAIQTEAAAADHGWVSLVWASTGDCFIDTLAPSRTGYERGEAAGCAAGWALVVTKAATAASSVTRGATTTTRLVDNLGDIATRSATRSLDDLGSLRGATPDEIRQLVPDGWVEIPLKKGEGARFLNPDRPGEALMVEMGWPNATDPLHAGPYLRISRNGEVLRVPLAGNPTLRP